MTLFWWTSLPTKINEHGWISPRNLPVFPGKIPQVSCVTHDEAATLERKRWELGRNNFLGRWGSGKIFRFWCDCPSKLLLSPFKSTLDSRNNSWWDDPSQPIKLRLRSVRKMRILFCWKKMHGAVKRWNLLVKKIKSKNYLKWVSVIVAPRLVGLLFGDEILLSY